MKLVKIAKLPAGISKLIGRTGLALDRYSPEILLVLGITGLVGAGILAAKETLKAHEVIKEHQEKLKAIEHAMEETDEVAYTEQDRQKDLTVAYTQTAIEWIKLYAPSVTLGILSIALILGSYRIMHKRSVALVATLKAVEEAFMRYRNRVIEEHGKDTDYMYRHGLRATEVIESEVDEKGKTKNVKTTKLIKTEEAGDMYARYFDSSSTEWSNKDPQYNLMYVTAQEKYFNQLLQTRGHVFLNEVYDALGLDRSRPGTVVGWALDNNGDGYIDFGIFNGDDARKRAFVNGHEESILLDFNVDGKIHHLLK